MPLTSITVEPLGRQYDRTAFRCGSDVLDRYLEQQARQDADKRVAAPFLAAAMAVLVDAKDENAVSFYRHYGFIPLQAQSNRLFLPMRSVAQLLAWAPVP